MGRKQKFFLFAVATLAALGIGVAFAQWTVNGGGSGSATALSAQNLTTITATTTAQLYPGITNANLYLDVQNPNPFPVTITGVHGNGTITPDSTHASGCVTTGVTFTDQTGLSQSVAANSQASFTVGGVTMTNSSDTGCQGATFTVPVTFDAHS
jgi:hypothetical protein